MRNLVCLVLSLLFLNYLIGQSDGFDQVDSTTTFLNEVVITDSKFELNRANSGKTVIKISEEELRFQAGKSLASVINQYSGIEVNGSRSHAGQNLSYNIRGGNNRQVLVLIDGIQISDASRIANDFDLQLLHLDLIESIEIMKGASSTLYGSGAATAVINIQTKSSSKRPIELSLSNIVGTNQSQDKDEFSVSDFSNALTASGRIGKFHYTGSFGHRSVDGLSSVIDSASIELDPFSALNGHVKLGVEVNNRFNFSVFGSLDKVNSDFDNSFPIENANFDLTSTQGRIGIHSNYRYDQGDVTINGSTYSNERIFNSNFPNTFNSNSRILDGFNRYKLGDQIFVVAGLNYLNHEIEIDSTTHSTNQWDPYLNAVYVSDFGFHLNGGLRLNNHSEYGSQVVFNVNPSFLMKLGGADVQLFGSYATSFITPTLNQLFGQFGPNPMLQPELNRTLETGVVLSTVNNLHINVLYFNREEDDFIDFTFTDEHPFGIYQNAPGSATFHGIELESEFSIIPKLNATLNYTFTESQDRKLLRVPKHKTNLRIGYPINRSFYTSIAHQFVGSREDTNFATFENESLQEFHMFDWYLRYQSAKSNLTLFLEITNLFNENYTEVIGFTTKGRNARLGMLMKL